MIGNNISLLRKERNVTQQEMAEVIGIERTSLSKIETGEFSPSAETMRKVSDYFNLPLGDIFFNPDVLKNSTESTIT